MSVYSPQTGTSPSYQCLCSGGLSPLIEFYERSSYCNYIQVNSKLSPLIEFYERSSHCNYIQVNSKLSPLIEFYERSSHCNYIQVNSKLVLELIH